MDKLWWSTRRTPPIPPLAARDAVLRVGANPQRIVNALADAAVDAAGVLLRQTGELQPPMLHLLAEDLQQPYLSCRPFRHGADAEFAISLLGWLPSTLAATRTMLAWDENDLSEAFGLPIPDPSTDKVVILDARLTGHTLRCRPYRTRPGPLTPDGRRTMIPTWGTPQHYPNGSLPPAVSALLDNWREPRGGNVHQTITSLETLGYRMHWAARHRYAPL